MRKDKYHSSAFLRQLGISSFLFIIYSVFIAITLNKNLLPWLVSSRRTAVSVENVLSFIFFPPRNVTHLVQNVKMFQDVDKSTDQLATQALNQQMKMCGVRPELYLVILSTILKGSGTSLSCEWSLTHSFLQAGCATQLLLLLVGVLHQKYVCW